MRINHNIASLNTYRQMGANNTQSAKSLEKLSSGLRINRAGDDAAGLAISEKMRGQIRGLDMASRNAQDSISLIQTAEGALNETHSILQRMRELAVQASNDTATDSDRAELQKEVAQLKSEVDRIASTTEFNSKKLLNGSLSAVKASQGTKANSTVIDAADYAATSGKNTAGLAVSISNASAAQSGTGFTSTAGAELAERTIIQTGVNDTFDIKINGVEYQDVAIAASTEQGYTRSEFVNALNTAIKKAVDAADPQDWGNEFNQAVFSLTSDNHLQVTTKATGSDPTIKVELEAPQTNANESALMAMGYSSKRTTITGTADLSSGYTLAAAGSNKFDVTIGHSNGAAVTIDLEADGNLTGASTYTFSELKDALQDALDKKLGQGAVTVGDDQNGHLVFKNNVSSGTFTIAANGALTTAADLGIVSTSSLVAQANNTTTKGTNTINANAAGTYISAGANDSFNISVDGGAAESIKLSAGNYATRQALVDEINNQINSNSKLVGKVSASLAEDGSNKIVFTSNTTGSSSDVTISNPTATNQSALGALGYAGAAGDINVAATFVDISPGLDLTVAADRKMDVTLGNRTVTIDLGNQDIINTDTGTTTKTSSRDAIVKALQAELDDAFGAGALSVNTVVDASAGTEKLTITNNVRGTSFKMGNGAAGNGATKLFGVAAGATGVVVATVSSDGVNTSSKGTDAIENIISDSTKLTELADSDGNKLGLSAGNVINITGTQNGNAFSAKVNVGDNSKVSDILNALRGLDEFKGATVALDTKTGKINITGANGETHDISNLKFTAQKSATDSTGIANFNRTFGNFTVTQQAQNASSDKSLTMQIGANEGQTLAVDINDMGTQTLRIQDIDVSTSKGAQTAISVVNNALEMVSAERSKLGAYQNRLEHTINNLGTSSENLTASESRIRDVDMAKEMMEFQKNNILSQAAQAMLAQANQQPQGVLQLLR